MLGAHAVCQQIFCGPQPFLLGVWASLVLRFIDQLFSILFVSPATCRVRQDANGKLEMDDLIFLESLGALVEQFAVFPRSFGQIDQTDSPVPQP